MLMQRTCRRRPRPRAAASRLVAGLNATPDLEPVRACGAATPRRVVRRLEVEGDPVGAGLGELGKVVGRVARPSGGSRPRRPRVDDRRDRPQHDRPDRHRRDEVAVADVEVEDAAARGEQRLDLLPEPREVGRVERRLDLASMVRIQSFQGIRASLGRRRPPLLPAARRRTRTSRGGAASSGGTRGGRMPEPRPVVGERGHLETGARRRRPRSRRRSTRRPRRRPPAGLHPLDRGRGTRAGAPAGASSASADRVADREPRGRSTAHPQAPGRSRSPRAEARGRPRSRR